MKCPICGNDNNCYVSSGKDPEKCWCHNEQFPEQLPDGDSCICRECVIKLKKEELRKQIIKTEKQFMDDAAKYGAKGWSSYFLEDGMMVSAGVNENIVGKDDILKAMESAFKSDFKLEWKPETIEFSDDYSLSYSTGRYIRTLNGETTYGKFLTIWKNTSNGWKVKVDIGN